MKNIDLGENALVIIDFVVREVINCREKLHGTRLSNPSITTIQTVIQVTILRKKTYAKVLAESAYVLNAIDSINKADN